MFKKLLLPIILRLRDITEFNKEFPCKVGNTTGGHSAVIVKSEHFPGCSEADSTNTLAPGDLFSIETLAAVVAIAEQIPRCQSTYAVSLRAPWEMFTFL